MFKSGLSALPVVKPMPARTGDTDAWKERLPKGIDAMVTMVIEGVQGYSGTMPPRGGNPNLSDDQIRETVQYMVDQLQ